jgi:hypothetical protein
MITCLKILLGTPTFGCTFKEEIHMTVEGYKDIFRKTAMAVITECDAIVADPMSSDARKCQLLHKSFVTHGLLEA